jgi:hypothetical protein
MRRTPPHFHPGPLTYAQAEALNQLARDLYGSLLGKFSAAPPLQVRQGLDGVALSLGADVGAGGVITRKNSGTPDFGPRPRLNLIEGTNIVLGMADDPTDNELDITITATAPAGAGIEVKEADGVPDYTGVSLLIVDGINLVLSQPAAGQAQVTYVNTDPDANLTTRGWVSLGAQTLGSGNKTVAGNVTVDTTLAGGTTSSVAMFATGPVQYTLTVSNINGLPRLSFAGSGATPTPYLGVGAAGSVSGKKVFDLVAADGYAFGGALGVTGTGGGGDTYSGGIATGLGTALTGGTGITIGGGAVTNTGVTSIIAGSGISVSGATGAVTVSLTVPVTIARGGTNSTTALNNNRIMISATGAIVEAAALTDGQLLIGSTGAAPAAATITAGAGISITNAAGAITVTNTVATANSRITTVDQTTTLLTAQNITGLSFSVLSGEVWSFECYIRNNKSALTAGIKYAVNAPATSTLECQLQGTTSATTAVQNERLSALATLSANAYNTVANADGFVSIVGVVVAGGNGTVQIQHASVTSGTATARINSYITARKIS